MGAVTGTREHFHEILTVSWKMPPVSITTGLCRVLAMGETAAGGHALRRRGISVGETCSAGDEPIEMGCADDAVAQCMDGIKPLLVCDQKENIRFFRHAS